MKKTKYTVNQLEFGFQEHKHMLIQLIVLYKEITN